MHGRQAVGVVWERAAGMMHCMDTEDRMADNIVCFIESTHSELFYLQHCLSAYCKSSYFIALPDVL